ncbi:PREDICTED: uncharacterized protein LOC104704215 [Camelina sativa]|uniref:Uncharacterized protein LOC104704215 n=1 Tax=Camelina sativa TaxID=90675 RepID=A0ABM1Q6X5_CAMSA|nr:PREDICTED: uncharacterized protein LOC104704215 [Camelina sativa]
MSNPDHVTFLVYFGGYWVKNHVGDVAYLNGKDIAIECKPEEFFIKLSAELGEGLYGQNMWYKYPFEEHNERKRLRSADLSFKRMCDAGRWTGVMNVFLVNSTEHPNDIESSEPCEEEIRVERNVASFVDEDEDFDYHNTPPNSDGEEEEEHLVRYKRGSGQLEIEQVFDSLEEFREALVAYALKEGCNIKISRWGKDKSAAVCGTKEPCPWYIYCSYEECVGKWKVKTFEDQHSCTNDNYCKILKAPVICKMFLDDIRTDPDYGPKRMQQEIEKNYNLIVSIDKCKNAKKKAVEIIDREHKEQFSRLKDYRLALLQSNPESTVVLDTVLDDDGSEIFHRFYVCFAAIRKMWSMWCRPIFGVDGCFMKCTLKGQLLAAVGRDANNGMYPMAWAVVDIENEDNWVWFLEKLKVDFNLQEGQGFTIISDRQKGLLNAVERELPYVEHRMCARHIYGNLKKIFPHQGDMKKLFWQVAESYTTKEYEANLELVKSYDMRVYEAMMEKNPKNCSLAFFTPTSSCVDVHNNISESFNNAIDPARYMPMVEMLETIRRRTMVRIDMRKTKADKDLSRVPPRIKEMIALEQKRLKFCKVIPGSDGRNEVRESGTSYSVNITMKTCACRRWKMSGVPCRHALRIIAEKKLNHEDYISSWLLNGRQQQIYRDSIRPVNGMCFWDNSGSVILPPPNLVEELENRKGRKPKPKRKKGKNESPKKKKASRERRIMHCRRCSLTGHNAAKCPNMEVERSMPPKKKKKTKPSADGGGPNL